MKINININKFTIKALIAVIACLGHIKLFAAFINYLDIELENESKYQINNIESANNEKGILLTINTNSILPGRYEDTANFRTNFLGQLSQDLKFDLYNNGVKSGECNLHIGIGSYFAKPDFSGSECTMNNGQYLQFNPRYDILNNIYKTYYKLTEQRSFSRIILFGDSMSDNGNLYKRTVELSLIFPMSPIMPSSPPYFKGRFTNGKVWVEHLADKLNIPEGSLINYAYAGASVEKDYMPIPHLDKQVNTYLNWNRTADPYALYVVWMGGNDFLRHFDKTDDDLIASVLNGIENNIRKLIQHGAKTILSPQLPDITSTPDSIKKNNENGNTEYTDRLDHLLRSYNQYHKSMIARLTKEFKNIKFMTYDVYKFIQDTRDRASDLGFFNVDERCNPNKYWEDSLEICEKPKEYVFWDGVHPSARAHQILSELLYDVINKSGYQPNDIELAAKTLDDDVVLRNKDAISSLHKDIDKNVDKNNGKNKKGLYGGYKSLEIVVKENIPLL